MHSANPPEYFLLLNADTIVRPECFQGVGRIYGSSSQRGDCGKPAGRPDGAVQASAFRFITPISEFETRRSNSDQRLVDCFTVGGGAAVAGADF